MNQRAPWLLAAACLLACATWLALSVRRPHGGTPLQEALRAMARPAAVPLAWAALEDARRAGHVHEAAGKARNLLALMPRWADGHLLYAMELALAPAAVQAATTQSNPDPHGSALDDARVRLLAAVAWLQDAAIDCPDQADELLSGAAFLLEQTEARDPALAELLRAEGRSPWEWADALHAQVAASGDSFGAKRAAAVRVTLIPALVADRLRSDDLAGARALVDRGLDLVPGMLTADGRAGWKRALTATRDVLGAAPATSLQSPGPESRRPDGGEPAAGPRDWTDTDRADPRLEPLWPWMAR